MKRFGGWWSGQGSIVGAGLVAAVIAACATPPPPSAFEDAFNDEAKPWVEVETQLPAKPVDADLIPFLVSGATTYRFGLDRKSLTIGTDGVYRYTLVAVSSQGARNVSYEGIRCDTSERKTYAIGRSDGTWSRARNAAWRPIEEVGNNRQHAALKGEYFCPDAFASRSTQEIFDRLSIRLPTSNAAAWRDVLGLQH